MYGERAAYMTVAGHQARFWAVKVARDHGKAMRVVQGSEGRWGMRPNPAVPRWPCAESSETSSGTLTVTWGRGGHESMLVGCDNEARNG